jgi:hypothetical protein
LRQDETERRNREAYIFAMMLADISAALASCETELQATTSSSIAEVCKADQMANVGARIQKARNHKEVVEIALRRCLNIPE